MSAPIILDVLLIVLFIAYGVYGYQTGLVRSLGSMVGVFVGGFLAVLLVPVVANLVEDSNLRTVATLIVVAALVIGGNASGAAIGALINRRMKRNSVRRVDRVLGAVITVVVTALVVSMLSASIAALGVPQLSQTIANSRVLAAINLATPDPVKGFLAQVRSATVDQSLPRIAQALGAHATPRGIPNVNTQTPALNLAAQSVVRITGNAYACGQSQSGSGFVVSAGHVITNAHVVAGVTNPVVDVRNGPALPSTVVYFDPIGDLAVLDVPGLALRSLPLTSTQPSGTNAVSDGYPYGGPFVSIPVGIDAVSTINVRDIYNETSNPRQVYSLSADVEEGDSGGPLLTTSGTVAGVIFAKGESTPNVGYAITMLSVGPLAAKAHSLSTPVSSGRCTRG